MKNENSIFNELKEISPIILQIKKVNVYSVSPTYFDKLSEEILKKTEPDKETVNILSTSTPYTTPGKYFENLSDIICKKVFSIKENSNSLFEETASIAPFLNTIDKKQLYTVPADYFEKKPELFIKAIAPKAKVISIYNLSKFFRIAAAAVVFTLLITGLYTINGDNFKNYSIDNSSKNKVRNLSKEEIVNFLRTNYSAENIPALHTANQIESSMKEISDEEIKQFLIETGESDDI